MCVNKAADFLGSLIFIMVSWPDITGFMATKGQRTHVFFGGAASGYADYRYGAKRASIKGVMIHFNAGMSHIGWCDAT